MTPDDLSLPSGTCVMVLPSLMVLELEWCGQAGRHVVRLDQTLDGTDGDGRDEAVANAVELFRNIVGLEVIEDALNAGQWPLASADGISFAPPDPWHRSGGV